MKQLIKGTLLTLSVVSLLGCQSQQPDNWLAEVNGAYITEDQVTQRIQSYPENMRAQLTQNQSPIINQLVNEEILYQEAKKQGIETRKDYTDQLKVLTEQLESAKRQLLTNLLINDEVNKKVVVSPEEVKAFYDNNSQQFAAFEQRNASHILVKTRKQALHVQEKANAGKSFTALAKKHSIDPTAQNGGELGWFRKGDLLPEFEKAVFRLKVGRISKVVKTKFGYHIIKLNDIKQTPKRTFEEVQKQIAQGLYNQKQNTALASYIEKTKESHVVTLKSDTEEKKAEQKPVSQTTANQAAPKAKG